MKLSVAMCTFNGERFLAEQLSSIREQSRLPDELVICDDVSTDRSTAIARQFAGTAPFPVRIQVNGHNLGSTCNFAQAIELCRSDIIALADQDDVWHPYKLAELERALQDNPAAGLVFSDAEMVDGELNSLGYSLWDALRFGPGEQEMFRQGRAFEALLQRHRVTGATMAFHAWYRDRLLPIPSVWYHDAWIALLISGVAPCVLVPRPLIRYRQHESQQLGEKKKGLYAQFRSACRSSREKYAGQTLCFEMARERLRQWPGIAEEKLALVERKVEHCRRRMNMRGRWRLPHIVRELWNGNYRRFSLGWKTMAQDLLLK